MTGSAEMGPGVVNVAGDRELAVGGKERAGGILPIPFVDPQAKGRAGLRIDIPMVVFENRLILFADDFSGFPDDFSGGGTSCSGGKFSW